jgi:hypothetical protein
MGNEMSEQEYKNFANRILDLHPELRDAMTRSERFAELKERFSLDEIGGERVYLVNDTQGDEDSLYIDALAKGVKGLLKDKKAEGMDEVCRQLYLELDDRLRSIVKEKIAGGE